MRHSAVVIPTRNRHQMLFDAVHSVIGQVDRVVIVDNGSDPAIVPEHWGMAEWWEGGKVGVIRYDEDPPNISRPWNVGLDVVDEAIRSAGEDEWAVAVRAEEHTSELQS